MPKVLKVSTLQVLYRGIETVRRCFNSMTDPNKYTLLPVKESDLPTRGKYKAIALNIIEDFDQMPERNVEVLNGGKAFKSKKEMMKVYDALKHIIKVNKLKIEARTDKGRLFLTKDFRYFIK